MRVEGIEIILIGQAYAMMETTISYDTPVFCTACDCEVEDKYSMVAGFNRISMVFYYEVIDEPCYRKLDASYVFALQNLQTTPLIKLSMGRERIIWCIYSDLKQRQFSNTNGLLPDGGMN